MDWKSLGGALIKAGAPIIGGALLGPPGALIGGAIGGVLASALGTDATPEAVNEALNTRDPAVLAEQLSRADAEAAAKWPALAEIAKAEADDRTAQSRAINQTIRAELGNVSWYHWRHIGGYVVLWISLIVSAGFIKAIFWGIPSAQDLAALIGAITPIFVALCALNGYIAQDTSGLKSIAAVGEKPEGAITTVAKTIAGAKKK